jgi:glycosyltransferase involved in cell wall biosynthesis
MTGVRPVDGRLAELREEMDRLRLENQRLRAEIEELRDPRARLRGLVQHGASALRERLRHLRPRRPVPRSSRAAPPGYEAQRVRPRLAPVERRPRVLHFIGNFYLGGSSQIVVDLFERLGHLYEQEVVTRDLPAVPAYLGIPVHHEPEFRSARQVLRRIRSFRPDLLHVHYLGHHRTAYSEADWRWYHHVFQAAEHDGQRVLENVNIPVDPYVSDAVSTYVYVSDYVRAEFGRVGTRGVTVYPGSDLSRFSRAAPVPDDTLGMVYRLEGDKLDERAIDVFIAAVRRRPATRALIVGGGRFLEAYRRRVEQAGVADAFTFTGYVSYRDLPGWYERMSVFVAPVHRESFGQVSSFAMGMAIPVIGYGVGAIPEIVGDDALLAPAGDAERLAEIAAGLLDDRERRLRIGERNRRRAEARYSVEAMVESYRRLYRALCADEPARGSGAERCPA